MTDATELVAQWILNAGLMESRLFATSLAIDLPGEVTQSRPSRQKVRT